MNEKTPEQRFIDAARELPPDYGTMRELLAKGLDINAPLPRDENDNLLTEVYFCYHQYCERCGANTWDDCDDCPKQELDVPGHYLPQVTQFFLDNGFDVTKENGRWGARALEHLMYAGHNPFILDCCKLLLSAGADPSICVHGDSDETVVDEVDFEGFFCAGEYGHHVENLYNAMVAMMEAKIKGRPFLLIEYYAVCIGRRVQSITLCAENGDAKGVFPVHTPTSDHENCYLDTIVLDCEGKMLCLTRYAEAIVDPGVPQRAVVRRDLGAYFKGCVGRVVTDIDFRHREIREGIKGYGQPVVRVHLDNGRVLVFSINHGEVPKEDMVAWFAVE